MCEICRKYRCPNGCPNAYSPDKRAKKDRKRKMAISFRLIERYESDGKRYGGILVPAPTKTEK